MMKHETRSQRWMSVSSSNSSHSLLLLFSSHRQTPFLSSIALRFGDRHINFQFDLPLCPCMLGNVRRSDIFHQLEYQRSCCKVDR